MSAAAASARRRRKHEKEREARRTALRRQREARAKRAQLTFDKLSADGKVLAESQVDDFLAEVVKAPQSQLERDAVELVINTARGQKQDKGKNDLPKETLLGAVEKYGEYVRKSKDIDDMFDKFDKNKDGVLSRSELKKALQAHERKANRSVKGIRTDLIIDDKDIDFILEQSDADSSGEISRSELLPAIAAWEELANIKIEKRKKSACTIM